MNIFDCLSHSQTPYVRLWSIMNSQDLIYSANTGRAWWEGGGRMSRVNLFCTGGGGGWSLHTTFLHQAQIRGKKRRGNYRSRWKYNCKSHRTRRNSCIIVNVTSWNNWPKESKPVTAAIDFQKSLSSHVALSAGAARLWVMTTLGRRCECGDAVRSYAS